MSASYLYIGNDSTIELVLKDQQGAAVTDAVVTLTTLTDKQGNVVAGITLPLTLNHDAAGVYSATIPRAVVVVAGRVYEATVTAASGGVENTWTEIVRAKNRSG